MTRRAVSLNDAGTSLIELVVAMVIMSIFLTLFTTAILMMTRSQNKVESVNATSTQLNQAFLALDKTVRYSAAISPPGVSTAGGTGYWYVELRTTSTGSEMCTQLRLNTSSRQLERRSWAPANLPQIAPSFAPLASFITNTASAQPFVLLDPALNKIAAYQQLTINLTSVSGSGNFQSTSNSSFTFSALNSTVPAPTSPVCQEEGRP